MTERRPATEAGRRVVGYRLFYQLDNHPYTQEAADLLADVLDIEREATDARVAALVADLPAAAAERPLDAERLALAVSRAVIEADRLYPAGYSMTGDLVPLIAAEYARLSEADR